MLLSLTVKTKHRCFEAGTCFEFRPGVNLLVGDQGCGKSTLLQGIAALCGCKKFSHAIGLNKVFDYRATPSAVVGFDFEHGNPRTQPYLDDNDPMTQMACMYSSHGQSNLAVIRAVGKAKDTVVFMDEPDMALSLRSITELIKIFKGAADRGCQIIAAVHHPFVIWAFPEVYDIVKRAWVASREFVDSQVQD
jgi:predicted ATPase